jgi:hypothetical protein
LRERDQLDIHPIRVPRCGFRHRFHATQTDLWIDIDVAAHLRGAPLIVASNRFAA